MPLFVAILTLGVCASLIVCTVRVAVGAHQVTLRNLFTLACKRTGLERTTNREALSCRVTVVKLKHEGGIHIPAIDTAATSLCDQQLLVPDSAASNCQ